MGLRHQWFHSKSMKFEDNSIIVRTGKQAVRINIFLCVVDNCNVFREIVYATHGSYENNGINKDELYDAITNVKNKLLLEKINNTEKYENLEKLEKDVIKIFNRNKTQKVKYCADCGHEDKKKIT